jgi:hypothetical protein
MTKVSLSDFATKILRNGRISFGDVQRLQRDILPDGLTSREEAEILIGLDRGAAKADAAWGRWLTATLVDFVVWGERPTGIVDEDTARWLAAALEGSAAEPGSKRARIIAREIVEEAQAFENDALVALAGLARPARRPAQQDAPAMLAA